MFRKQKKLYDWKMELIKIGNIYLMPLTRFIFYKRQTLGSIQTPH